MFVGGVLMVSCLWYEEEYEGKQYWIFDVSPIEVPKVDQFFVDKQTGKVYNSYGYEI
jgi:hypothetical protein